MYSRSAENLFRQAAIDALATRLDGRPIAILPRPLAWLAGFAVVLIVCACCFLLSVEYARKETVRGWLVAKPGVVRLAHNDFATVIRVDRKPGDPVRRGETIVQLSSEVKLGTGREQARQALQQLREQVAALDTREALAREQFNADYRSLEWQLDGVIEEAGSLGDQFRRQTQRMQRSGERLTELRDAYEHGAIARVELLRHEDDLIALQVAVARLEQEQDRLGRQRHELIAAQERLGIEFERRLAILESERGELQQRMAVRERQRRVTVPAPVDGTLATVDVTAGSTVRPQDLLATIIPRHATLLADVYVPSRAAGMIRSGQGVRLRYDAFPHQRFGSASGVVDAVAGFVTLPVDMPVAAGLREAAYKVRIRPAANYVQDDSGRYALRPGMALAAEIVLESRSLADWFLAPLRAHF